MKMYANLNDAGCVLSVGYYANPPIGNCVEIAAIPTENGAPVDATRIAFKDGSLIIRPAVEQPNLVEPPSLEQRTEALEAAVLEIIMGVSA